MTRGDSLRPHRARTFTGSAVACGGLIDGASRPASRRGDLRSPWRPTTGGTARSGMMDDDEAACERQLLPATRHPDEYTRRRQQMDRVINDQQQPRLKPFPVEQQLMAELGSLLGDFAQFVEPVDAEALRAETWPWHVACCWIMTQDPKGALLAVSGFAVWQGCTVRDDCRPGHVMSFAEASAVLRRALIRGEVRAKRDDGALALTIAADEWLRLSWPVDDGETRCFHKLVRDGVATYEYPVILAVDVLRWRWTLNGPELHPGYNIGKLAVPNPMMLSQKPPEVKSAPKAEQIIAKKPGRQKGSGSFRSNDLPLAVEVMTRVDDGEAQKTVLNDVAKRAVGRGTPESRAKRIERLLSEVRESESRKI